MDDQSAITTFLFTDIEGSSELWEKQPERMRPALARHDDILRAAILSHSGTVVKMTGDGVCAAFQDPLDSVRAAIAIQLALADPEATAGLALRARSGMHLGVVERRDGDYFGNPLNRAARIMNAAHGGQILISQAVVALVYDRLPGDMTLRDLGSVRLRGLSSPERIHQLLHPALPRDFPALRSLASTPNNLLQQVTSFFGRERELADLKRLLETTRLLTLTAIGGSGKTRLAIELARSVLESFPDGVTFVDLAPVAAPERVAQTVAATLGIREEPDVPIIDTVCARLEGKRTLIVLDNCEHLVAACAAFVEGLLAHTVKVAVVATSRERLGIAGEHVVVIRPLENAESVRLFVDRAQLAAPDFAPGTLSAVEDVCRRLEGLPLAIELAAARVKVLSVEEINARLHDRFRLLTAGGRAPARHQTLRGVIDWSYEQLAPSEQQALRDLSVFAGGWTLLAATAVTAADESDTIETLSQLVDKSLVQVDRSANGDLRYRMLETVRAYAEEQLELAGETREARARHLDHFVSLADSLPEWRTVKEIPAFERLDDELDNMLAALEWCKHSATGAEVGLRLVLALRRYLVHRGHVRLGRSLIEHWLAHPDLPTSGVLRARALLVAGGFAEDAGDDRAASAYVTSALVVARDAGERDVEICSLKLLGSTARTRGDLAEARDVLEQSLALARACGTPFDVASALVEIGECCRMERDLDGAAVRYEEGVTILRRHGLGITDAVLNLVTIATERRDYVAAGGYLHEAVVESRAHSSLYLDWCVLQHAANLASAAGDAPFAARAWGALESVAAATGLVLQRADVDHLRDSIGRARRALGEQGFEKAHAAGRALKPEDAVAEVDAWLQRYLGSARPETPGTATVKS